MDRKIHYFAPYTDERIVRQFGPQPTSNAAVNKVFGICDAVQYSGVPIAIVTYASRRASTKKELSPFIFAEGNLEVVCCYSCGKSALRRISASFSLLFYAFSNIRPQHRVVLYNFFPEYFLVAIYLALISNRAVVDVEDAPHTNPGNFREIVTALSWYFIRFVSAKYVVTASDEIAKYLKFSNHLTVYGIAPSESYANGSMRRFQKNKYAALFGGTIIHETGLQLFSEAIKIFSKKKQAAELTIHISGNYDQIVLQRLADELSSCPKIRLVLESNMTRAEYVRLVSKVDFAFSLKLSNTEIGKTTFPSKVIEIASFGALLVTTVMSDISKIFSNENAYLLQGETPEELAEVIHTILSSPEDSAAKAEQGQKVVREICTKEVVGRKIVSFLYDQI